MSHAGSHARSREHGLIRDHHVEVMGNKVQWLVHFLFGLLFVFFLCLTIKLPLCLRFYDELFQLEF